MMYRLFFPAIFLVMVLFPHCSSINVRHQNVRPLRDTTGFAQYSWQMDSLISRMRLSGWKESSGDMLKLAICPHDDYTYAGVLYPEVLQHVKAPLVILLGVAHGASRLGIEDDLVFDSFKYWKGPWGNVPVNNASRELLDLLGSYVIVNDSLQTIEHSLESMIPFLQFFNREVSIIPVLVPAMNPQRMEECGKALAEAISVVARNKGWEWGRDFTLVVTTDAVHYGNEQWGGADYAFYGCDEPGNIRARDHEAEIIHSCLTGQITPDKIQRFNSYTLDENDYKKYRWTWCGRYSVPVALYCAQSLDNNISGRLIGYSTSITSDHIRVDDLGMGTTAIAAPCHWVGYAALGYH